MAFALKGAGSATTANSAAANQASLVVTTATTAGAANDLAVLLYAVDNNATVDGDEGAVTGVTDSAGNFWQEGAEFTNGQGTAQTGATCGIWYCNLQNAIAIGATVTLAFSNSASRDASAASLTYFTKAAGFKAAVEGTPGTLANDAAAAGSLSVTTANIACLRIRAIASESSTATALTKTAAFTAVLTQSLTSTGASAANQGIRGEYLISTGTGTASAPTGGAGAVDNASVYVAFREDAIFVGDPPHNSDQVAGAQVAISIRKAVTTSSVSASAGSFLLPYPTVQVPEGTPQGWWAELDRPIYVSSARFASDLVWPLFFEGTATVTDVGGWWGQLSPAVVTSRVNFASDLAWLPIPVQTYVQPDATNAVTFGISQDNGRTTVQMVGY